MARIRRTSIQRRQWQIISPIRRQDSRRRYVVEFAILSTRPLNVNPLSTSPSMTESKNWVKRVFVFTVFNVVTSQETACKDQSAIYATSLTTLSCIRERRYTIRVSKQIKVRPGSNHSCRMHYRPKTWHHRPKTWHHRPKMCNRMPSHSNRLRHYRPKLVSK